MTDQAEKESPEILVVDDQENIGRLLSQMLHAEGYGCATVDSAKKAIRELEHNEYCLVLTDINMPEMNGVQLLKLIIEKDQDIAVIMLTGVQELDTAVHCLKLGAYDYLSKPVNLVELSSSVSRALVPLRLEMEFSLV